MIGEIHTVAGTETHTHFCDGCADVITEGCFGPCVQSIEFCSDCEDEEEENETTESRPQV